MIRVEEMPVSAQKAYKVTNIVRKAAMFIGWGLIVILWIIAIFLVDSPGLTDFLSVPICLAGCISGIIHGELVYKKTVRTLKKFSLIGLAIGMFVFLFLLEIFVITGSIFLIADTVLFFMKKPLVYPFEHKYFLESRKAQEEIETAIYNEMMRTANGENAMNKIQKLKEMMEQGIITEDEFNRKKTELLDEI